MSMQLSGCQLFPPTTPRPVLLKVVLIHALFHQYFDFKCHRSNLRLGRQVRFALWLLSKIWSKVQRSGRPGHTVCTLCVRVRLCETTGHSHLFESPLTGAMHFPLDCYSVSWF